MFRLVVDIHLSNNSSLCKRKQQRHTPCMWWNNVCLPLGFPKYVRLIAKWHPIITVSPYDPNVTQAISVIPVGPADPIRFALWQTVWQSRWATDFLPHLLPDSVCNVGLSSFIQYFHIPETEICISCIYPNERYRLKEIPQTSMKTVNHIHHQIPRRKPHVQMEMNSNPSLCISAFFSHSLSQPYFLLD